MWSAESVLVCALALLGRSEQRFPTVRFVEKVPAGVSPSAEGYVQAAEGRIVLVTATSWFTQARRAKDRCGDLEALREIAGVLAHEEWHLQHGPDEEGAYLAQLTALQYVGAGQDSRLFHKVKQSKQAVSDAAKRATDGRTLARGAAPDGVDHSSPRAAPARRGDGP